MAIILHPVVGVVLLRIFAGTENLTVRAIQMNDDIPNAVISGNTEAANVWSGACQVELMQWGLRLLDEMPVKRGSIFRDHILVIARERLKAKIGVLTKAIGRGKELMYAPPAIGAPYSGDVVMI